MWGNFYAGAESLMKKHEVLETEVNVREQLVKTVQKTGECLISEEHYASEDILENNSTLREAWTKLLETIENRRKKLVESLQVQKVRRLHLYFHFVLIESVT